MAEIAVPAEKEKRQSLWIELVVRLVKEKPLGTVGGVLVLILFITGIFADLLAPYGMNEIILVDRLDPPSLKHILGTDNLGRDLLSRIVFGARISMYVGLGGSFLSVMIGTVIGLISGFFGGKVDMFMQRFVDAFMCFPPLFLYLTVMSVLGPGLLQVIVVLGTVSGINRSRIIRSAVIGVKENIYVEAARAIGSKNGRIIARHIFPNVTAAIMVHGTITVGHVILAEATLSFLGFGIPPPTPSWGGMLSGSGRQYMLLAPWMALWPGVALALAVYGVNMLGDALRDLLDPRLRGGLGRFSGVAEKATKQRERATKE
jgi:peptide/nickel transport system permease protein